MILTHIFSGEYYLGDYIQKIANFNISTITSVFASEGYFDLYNYKDATDIPETRQTVRTQFGHEVNSGKMTYEFTLTPNLGFLGSPEPLLSDCELTISFDRASASNAFVDPLNIPDADKPSNPDGDYIKINNCVAITEWVSSPNLRNYFSSIEDNPIIYEYDDINILTKYIPSNTTHVRFDNLRGGNLPEYIFAGIIPRSVIEGDYKKSSTCFYQSNVSDFNISLNGHSVHGYPMEVHNGCVTFPMQKFFDTTNRFYNIQCGENLSPTKFKYNFLWAHKFEGDATPQGWLGINFKLDEGFADSDPHVLIVWVVTKNALQIDNFHQIQNLNL